MDIVEQLRRISPMPADAQLEEHPEFFELHDAAMKRLATEMKPDLIPCVLKTFGYGFANEGYYEVVHLLETQPADTLHQALRQSLRTGHDGERMWAAHMLGRFEDAKDFDLLEQRLEDPRPLVRAEVVTAISRLSDPRARPALLKLQADEQEEEVQSSLKYGLKHLGEG